MCDDFFWDCEVDCECFEVVWCIYYYCVWDVVEDECDWLFLVDEVVCGVDCVVVCMVDG